MVLSRNLVLVVASINYNAILFNMLLITSSESSKIKSQLKLCPSIYIKREKNYNFCCLWF